MGKRLHSKSEQRSVRRKLLALAIAQGIAATAQAATITVNSNADMTADDGVCTLREAVVSANTDSASGALAGECIAGDGADTIVFDSSLVDQTITLTAAGSNGDLDVINFLTIQGPGASSLTISGNSNSRLFTIFGVVDIDGLTLRDGLADAGGLGSTGGAILNRGNLTLSNSTVSSNTAASGGGGIYNDAVMATVTDSTLAGNSAGGYGGGIYSAADLTMTKTTVSGNSALGAGGIAARSGLLTLTNSTVSGNSATFGAGLRVGSAFSPTAIITNSTIVGNSAASYGGGLLSTAGTVNLTNTVIANSIGDDCQDNGAIATNLNNLIDDGTCADSAVNLLSGDPELGPLADNGGPTQTHAVIAGSPVIDAGDDAACPGTDQRGRLRPEDGDGDGDASCDIGAFEWPLTQLVFTDGFEGPPP